MSTHVARGQCGVFANLFGELPHGDVAELRQQTLDLGLSRAHIDAVPPLRQRSDLHARLLRIHLPWIKVDDGWLPAALLRGALLFLGLATVGAARFVQPFYGWYYHWAWYPTLVALAAGYALAFGRPPGTPRFALSLLFWSAPLWFLFELINFRLANWYYVYASASRLDRVVGAFGAFATVLPAIYLAEVDDLEPTDRGAAGFGHTGNR